MKVTNYEAVPQNPVEMEGADKCHVRILVGESDGAPNFAMRQFEVEIGGYTPKHHHPYEHEIFVIEGQGVVLEGDHEHPLAKGDVVLVKPDEVHQFRNTGRYSAQVPLPHSEFGGGQECHRRARVRYRSWQRVVTGNDQSQRRNQRTASADSLPRPQVLCGNESRDHGSRIRSANGEADAA